MRRALRAQNSKADIEKVADDVLKDALAELQQTGRTADKILRAKLIRQESKHALDKIHELDEEFDDREEEEAPQDDIQVKLTDVILNKLIGGKTALSKTNNVTTQQSPDEIIDSLSPEQVCALKEKFLK